MHMAQLMPLPLTVSCFSKIQIGFTFLVSARPGSPGQRAVKRVCVCVCVCPCPCVCVCDRIAQARVRPARSTARLLGRTLQTCILPTHRSLHVRLQAAPASILATPIQVARAVLGQNIEGAGPFPTLSPFLPFPIPSLPPPSYPSHPFEVGFLKCCGSYVCEPVQEQIGQVLAKIWALKAWLNQPIIRQVHVQVNTARRSGQRRKPHSRSEIEFCAF